MSLIEGLYRFMYPAYMLLTLSITIYGLLLLRRVARAVERGADALEARLADSTAAQAHLGSGDREHT